MLYQIENRDKQPPLSAVPVDGLSTLPHIHPHIELIYLMEGSSLATVDRKDYLIESGDLFLSFPNQVHFYHDRSAVNGYLVIFPPDFFTDFQKLFHTKIPDSPIIKSAQLPPDTAKILSSIIQKSNSDSSYDKIAAKGYLLALLGEMLPVMSLKNTAADEDSIKKILSFCSQHYTEPLSLETLSKELHLNKYYISHIFKERMDMGFIDFLNNMRVEHSCGLLKKGENITNIALSSGFSSIRTFNRVFAGTMGMSPREYIRLKENAL